jgi:hypothetical protein
MNERAASDLRAEFYYQQFDALAALEITGLLTSRQLRRNRQIGQRERGPHESFLLVSPYS